MRLSLRRLSREPAGAVPAGPQDPATAEDRWIVAGLGNPGPEYSRNRHNVGFAVADLLATRAGVAFKRDRARAQLATGRLAGRPVLLVKPMSYMNVSGGPLTSVSGYYKVPPDRTIVVHDELDLPFGTIRLKLGGGDNGHNGLRSVTSSLGTRDYFRVRVGVGRPSGRQDPADFLLSDFNSVERKELTFVVDQAADAVQALLDRGLSAAQNEFH